jgi:superfamily I DNA and/or RNA helicase/very-short-patch-repair endonuclease
VALKTEFIKTLAKYYQEFLSSDFKKGRAPKRRFSSTDPKGRRVGIEVDKYTNLYTKLINKLSDEKIETRSFSIKKNKFSTNLSEINKRKLKTEIESIDFTGIRKGFLEIVLPLSEKYTNAKTSPNNDLEFELFTTSLETLFRTGIISELVDNISSSIESAQTRALDSLIDIEEELTEMCLDSYISSVSEIFVEFLNTKDVKNLDSSFNEYLDIFNFKDIFYNYFENLQTGDAFSELREVKLNENMVENVEFYLNIGTISYKKDKSNYKFPIFYLPFELTLLENKAELSFNPNLFINKKAIDFVLEDIAKKYDKKQRSIVEDRLVFLNENENILDKVSEFLLKLQNTLELNEIINFDYSIINKTKSADVTISTSLTISLFDKSDESMENDYESLITGLESGTGVDKLFKKLITSFVESNPTNFVNDVEDAWEELDTTNRLVYKSPLPLAEEQRKILNALENKGVQYIFVEGPPGTGKSHTISAIAFDSILKNKSILVLSDKKEALDVVEGKLNETLNKTRVDGEFPNPILRLGKKENNFYKLTTNTAASNLQNNVRVRTTQDSVIKKEDKEITNNLTSSINGFVERTKNIEMEKVKTFFEFRESINPDVLNQIEQNRDLLDNNIGYLNEIKTLFSENHDELNSIYKLLEKDLKSIKTTMKIYKELNTYDNDFLEFLTKLPKLTLKNIESLDDAIERLKVASNSLFGFSFKKKLFDFIKEDFKNTYGDTPQLVKDKSSLETLISFKEDFIKLQTVLDATYEKEIIIKRTKFINLFLESKLFKDDNLEVVMSLISDNQDNEFTKELKIIFEKSFNFIDFVEDEESSEFYFYSISKMYIERFNELEEGFNFEKIDYFGNKSKLEQLNASKLSFNIDKKAIQYVNDFKADIKIIRNIIKKKKKFPTQEFESLQKGFPCIISSLRDFAEFIPLYPNMFDVVVIDEASQVSIAQALPALLRAKKVIVMGDRNQFSNVKTNNASKELNNQYLNSLIESYDNKSSINTATLERIKMFNIKSSVLDFFEMFSNFSITLKKHFRSYPEMISFSSKYFYQDALQSMKIRAKSISEIIEFHHLDDVKFPEFNTTNTDEINFIIKKLEEQLKNKDFRSAAIITPHTEQQNLFLKKLSAHTNFEDFTKKLNLKVFTFDGCQGEERDIIYYSLVASEHEDKLWAVFPKELDSNNGDIDFNLRKQRLNVGFSRGREKIVFVLSKEIQEYSSSIKTALNHYKAIYENSSKAISKDQLDPNSPMEEKVLEWLQKTELYQKSINNPEEIKFTIFPQLELGKYLKSLDINYTYPEYKVDFFVNISTTAGSTNVIVEYDGFEYHFHSWDEVTSYNWKQYLTEEDIERELILESFGYKMIRLNKFNIGAKPIETLNNKLLELVEERQESDADAITNLISKQKAVNEGLKNKKMKICPSCQDIKPLFEFFDNQLKSEYGNTCMACKRKKGNFRKKKCASCKKMKLERNFKSSTECCECYEN